MNKLESSADVPEFRKTQGYFIGPPVKDMTPEQREKYYKVVGEMRARSDKRLAEDRSRTYVTRSLVPDLTSFGAYNI